MKIKKIQKRELTEPQKVFCITVNDPKHLVIVRAETIGLLASQSVNFGFLFGGSWFVFQQNQLIKNNIRITQKEAEDCRAAFMALYKTIAKNVNTTKFEFDHAKPRRVVVKNAYGNEFVQMVPYNKEINTLFGRRICVETANTALNYPVQGSGGDMIKIACCIFEDECERLGLQAYIINYIHDDVVVEGLIEEKEQVLHLFAQCMNTAANAVMGAYFNTDVTSEVVVLTETPLEVA